MRSVRPKEREVSDSGKEKCQTQGKRSVRLKEREVSDSGIRSVRLRE